MSEEIKKYDVRGYLIYKKYSDDDEVWYKYNENGNLIYYKNPKGLEYWWKHDENNRATAITKKEFKEIEFRKQEKEYLSRTKVSRFELMEI